MAAPIKKDEKMINPNAPRNYSFAENTLKNFKVSEFQGRIIKNLIESKGLHNVIRELWYSILDAIIRFYLASKNPVKNQKYDEYMLCRRFYVQIGMAEISQEKTIKAIFKSRNEDIGAQIKAKETSKEDRNKLKAELKKRLQKLEELQSLRNEAIQIKETNQQNIIKKTEWEWDEILLDRIKRLPQEIAADAQTYEVVTWLQQFASSDIKKILEREKDVRNGVQAVKKALEEKIKTYEIEKKEFEADKEKKLRDNLHKQLAEVFVEVNYKKLDESLAKDIILKIVDCYPQFKQFYEKLKPFVKYVIVDEKKVVDNENNFKEMRKAVDQFFAPPKVVVGEINILPEEQNIVKNDQLPAENPKPNQAEEPEILEQQGASQNNPDPNKVGLEEAPNQKDEQNAPNENNIPVKDDKPLPNEQDEKKPEQSPPRSPSAAKKPGFIQNLIGLFKADNGKPNQESQELMPEEPKPVLIKEPEQKIQQTPNPKPVPPNEPKIQQMPEPKLLIPNGKPSPEEIKDKPHLIARLFELEQEFIKRVESCKQLSLLEKEKYYLDELISFVGLNASYVSEIKIAFIKGEAINKMINKIQR